LTRVICIHANREKILTIPPFHVNLSLRQSTTSLSHQLEFSSKLKSATSSHLFDYFEAKLDDRNQGGQSRGINEILNSIDLEITLTQIGSHDDDDDEGGGGRRKRRRSETKSDGQLMFQAEMIGTVSFERTDLNQVMVREYVQDAFDNSIAMDEYLSRVQIILPSVASLEVETDIDLVPSTGKGTGSRSFGSTVGIVLFTLSLICAGAVASLWVYRRYGKRRFKGKYKNGHLLMNANHPSDYYDGDDDDDGDDDAENGQFSGGIKWDGEFSNDTTVPEPIQFIPVPARFDEVTDGRKKTNKGPHASDVTPRRYVKPASPFEILYGAAFAHSEQARVAVEQARVKWRKKPSVTHRILKNKKIMKPLKPLNTITEVNEDELKTPDTNSNESFLPQIISSISSYITEKFDSSPGEKDKEEFLVYRDFPRHDGTPCVMFTPIDEVDWDLARQESTESKTPPRKSFQNLIKDDDADISYTSSQSSVFVDKEETVDNFVDKLENLMASRSRQYEERKKLDKEVAEKKKARFEQRKLEKESTNQNTHDENVDIDTSNMKHSHDSTKSTQLKTEEYATNESADTEDVTGTSTALLGVDEEERADQENILSTTSISNNETNSTSTSQSDTSIHEKLLEYEELQLLPQDDHVNAFTTDTGKNNILPVEMTNSNIPSEDLNVSSNDITTAQPCPSPEEVENLQVDSSNFENESDVKSSKTQNHRMDHSFKMDTSNNSSVQTTNLITPCKEDKTSCSSINDDTTVNSCSPRDVEQIKFFDSVPDGKSRSEGQHDNTQISVIIQDDEPNM